MLHFIKTCFTFSALKLFSRTFKGNLMVLCGKIFKIEQLIKVPFLRHLSKRKKLNEKGCENNNICQVLFKKIYYIA